MATPTARKASGDSPSNTAPRREMILSPQQQRATIEICEIITKETENATREQILRLYNAIELHKTRLLEVKGFAQHTARTPPPKFDGGANTSTKTPYPVGVDNPLAPPQTTEKAPSNALSPAAKLGSFVRISKPLADGFDPFASFGGKTTFDLLNTQLFPQPGADKKTIEPKAKDPSPLSVKKQLSQITIPLSEDDAVQNINDIALKFCTELSGKVVEVRKNNSLQELEWTWDEAVEMTDFFFHHLFGLKALNRATSILTAYAKREDGVDRGAADRAQVQSTNVKNPNSVRQLYDSLAKQYGFKDRRADAYNSFRFMDQAVRTATLYADLKRTIETDGAELQGFLISEGYSTSFGKGWTTLLIDFMSDRVDISRQAFTVDCQRALGIKALVHRFGFGILPILPQTILHRTNGYGNQKMEAVYELLEKHCPFLREIATLLEIHLYNPMMQGGKPTINPISASGRSSYTERLQSALDGATVDNGAMDTKDV